MLPKYKEFDENQCEVFIDVGFQQQLSDPNNLTQFVGVMPTIGLRAAIGHELRGSVSIIMRVPFSFTLILLLFGEEQDKCPGWSREPHIIAREEIVLGEITPENTNLNERKVVPFSIMLTEKFSPSFTIAYEDTIL